MKVDDIWDVAIIGAGVAGCAAAIAAASRGNRVLLLDGREEVGTRKVSTLYIQPTGVMELDKLGLLPTVLSADTPEINSIRYEIGSKMITGSVSASPTVFGIAPKRSLLDGTLVDGAARAGVSVMLGCRVRHREIQVADDNAPFSFSISFEDRDATRHLARTRLVVGADGANSVVAKAVGAAVLRQDRPRTFAYYQFFDADATDSMLLVQDRRRWLGDAPTNDGQRVVAVYFPASEFDEVRSDPSAHYLKEVRRLDPGLALPNSSGSDKLHASGLQRNYVRTPVGKGWCLLGDAFSLKDSITAKGLANGLEQARIFGEALDDRGWPSETWRERLSAKLKSSVLPDYENALATAEFSGYDARLELAGFIASSKSRTRAYLDVVGGMLPPEHLLEEWVDSIDASLSGDHQLGAAT